MEQAEKRTRSRNGSALHICSQSKPKRSATVASTEHTYKEIVLEISMDNQRKDFRFDENTRIRDVIGFLKESYPEKSFTKAGLHVNSTGIWLKTNRSIGSYFLAPHVSGCFVNTNQLWPVIS
jgi:hypothetical protein